MSRPKKIQDEIQLKAEEKYLEYNGKAQESSAARYAWLAGWYLSQAAANAQEAEQWEARAKELELERDELRANSGMYLEEVDEMLCAMAEEVEPLED